MMGIVKYYLSMPTPIRAAVLMLIILLLWAILGKKILFILSIIPFGLRFLFKKAYIVIEFPLSMLHRKLGGIFHKIENQWSKAGKGIDEKIFKWYSSWHNTDTNYFGRVFLICFIMVIYISLPQFIKIEHIIINFGERLYLAGESSIVTWLVKQDLDDSSKSVAADFEGQDSGMDYNSGNENQLLEDDFEERLIVAGLKSSLLLRDIPSVQNSAALARLHNGDIVIWKGQLVFSEVDGRVEPWVKITTSEGIEGWSRLLYLHPEIYENIEFNMVK